MHELKFVAAAIAERKLQSKTKSSFILLKIKIKLYVFSEDDNRYEVTVLHQ